MLLLPDDMSGRLHGKNCGEIGRACILPWRRLTVSDCLAWDSVSWSSPHALEMGHPADCHQHCGLYPCLALFVFFYQDIYGLATGFLPQTPPQTWYAWFCSPPALPGVGYWLPLLLLTAWSYSILYFSCWARALPPPFLMSWPNATGLVTGRSQEEHATAIGGTDHWRLHP